MPPAHRSLIAICLLLALLHIGPASQAAPTEATTPSSTLTQRSARWLAGLRERMHLPEKIARPLRIGLCRVRGACTLMADRLETGLPPLLARGFHKIRLVNPLALPAFAGSKIKEDPLFLTGFGIASTLIQELEIPALMAVGVSPGLAFAIHQIIETPINLAVIGWRQHHLRKDRSQSFLGTLRGLGHDYRAFVEKRQDENRRFTAAQRAQTPAGGTLTALGTALR